MSVVLLQACNDKSNLITKQRDVQVEHCLTFINYAAIQNWKNNHPVSKRCGVIDDIKLSKISMQSRNPGEVRPYDDIRSLAVGMCKRRHELCDRPGSR